MWQATDSKHEKQMENCHVILIGNHQLMEGHVHCTIQYKCNIALWPIENPNGYNSGTVKD